MCAMYRYLPRHRPSHALVPCFASSFLPHHRGVHYVRRETCTRNPILAARMSMTPGRVSLYTGITALAAVLTNRLFFTPFDSLALTQSRSDILAVITGATLVLYGVGKAEIADKKPAVELSGVDIRRGFENGDLVGREVEWAMDALIEAVPNVRSCAVVVDGVGRYLVGRFRGENVAVQVLDGGVVAGAIESGKRAYMADMKVVPVKETEFGFFPENCQAVIVQPVSECVALLIAADKPRPFTGDDFGWLQAVIDRMGGAITDAREQ